MANESTNANATNLTDDTTGDAGSTSNNGQEINVTLVDGVCVVTTNDVTSNLTAPIFIEKPAAGEVAQIDVVPGQKYFFDFEEGAVEAFVQEGDDLTLQFADGSSVILNGFGTAANGSLPATLAFSDALSTDQLANLIQVVDTTPDADALDEPQAEVRDGEDDVADSGEGETDGSDVASVQPAAGEETTAEEVANVEPEAGEPSAQQLAQIEPAAGDQAGGNQNSGFSFESFDATPVGALDAVGPLDPTVLQYGVDVPTEDLLPNEEVDPDDSPELTSPDVINLDETNLGPLSFTDTLDVDFGNDGPGTICADGNFSFSGSALGGNLTSGGQPITVTDTPDGYVGTINGGADVIFELRIDKQTGEYTFTQFDVLDHADPNNPDDVIQFTFGVEATDADGDTASTQIVVNVADDAPAVAAPDSNTIDETNLGPIVINDALVVDFGNDGAGAVTPEGTSTVTGVTTLTSGGDPITITPTADGYIGTLPGGATAFELVIDPATGAYTYTQNVPFDHNAAIDTITLDFAVNVTDYDGDTTQTNIIVNITDSVPEINDKPKIGDGLEVVDESDLPGVTANGALTVDFGGDGPGAVTPNDTFNSGGSQLGGNLTSGGQPVDVNLVGDTYVGTINGGADTIFTLQVNPDGSYEFNLIGTLDHADPNDPNDIIDLEFGVTVTDGDGDTATTTIIVKVKDDVPVIGDSQGDVDETNLDGGPISTSDTLFTSFGTEVGTIQPDGNFGATAGGNPIALTSGLQPVSFAQTATGYVGTINGGADIVFEITVDPSTGQYTYTQFAPFDHPDGTDPNDIIELSFGVEITSTDGDSDTGTITINVADDGPIANDDVTGAEEGQVITGDVTANDDLSEDVANTVSAVEFNGTTFTVVPGIPAVIATSLGTLTLNSDGTYTYEATDLGDPDGTDVFTYTLIDSDGDSDTATLSVRVTPDGEPIAVTETMTVDETNLTPGPLVINETMNVDFGLDGQGSINPNGTTSTGGSLAGGSLTSGGQPVDIQTTANGYVGVISGTTTQVFELIVQDNGDYSFELFQTLDHADATDPNDLIRLDFGVTVSDSDGDTADGTITINVLDDAPVAFDDVNSVPQNQTTATGNVVNNDIQGEDAPSNVTSITFGTNTVAVVPGTPTVLNGAHGVLTINSDGSYSYTSNGTNTAAVTDVFTYALTDFDGDTDTAELTINIADVDDKPILADPDPLLVDETDITDSDSDTIIANFGNDGPGTFTVTGAGTFTHVGGTNGQLTSDGVPVNVDVQGNSYVGTANGQTIFTLTLNNTTGAYDFTLTGVLDHADTTDPDDIIELSFGVTATDADGDTDTGAIVVQVKDDGPVANDDCNEFTVTATNQDFNVVMALDVSGSMSGEKIALLKSSVTNLLTDFNGYNGGEIKVHLVPFSNNAGAGQTFTITNDVEFNAALNFLNGLNANGTTNYEAPLQSAISWLQGDTNNDPIAGADTYTYFVSDGAPNRYLNNNGNVTNGSADTVMGEITGTDGTDEVGILQGLSTEVIGVGIGVDATTIARLGVIDSDGTALDVQDPTDLDAALQGTNPLAGQTSGNVITGQGGGAGAADDLSNDVDNTVTQIAFGGNTVDVDPVNGATINGAFGTLTINADGSYTYKITATNITGNITENFIYTLTDGDGDTSTATLALKGTFEADDQPDLTTSEVVVDETDLNPTDDASNSVTADFGNDGPGTYALVGLNGFNGALNNQLTSNGTAVNVNNEGGDLVGRAGGNEVFRLALDEATGQYTFTLSGTLDHADPNNPDDVIELLFTVQAEDSDGDTDSGIITVNVKDDGPSISGKARRIHEDALETQASVSYTHTLNHDYGEDGPGEIRPTDTFSAKFQANGPDVTLTSGGDAIVVTETADGYIGVAGGDTVFTLSVQSNGQYTYTQFEPIDHPDGDNPDDVIWLKFGVQIVDADGDTAPATIIVDVHDGAPRAVDDTDSVAANQTTTSGNVITNDETGPDTPVSVTMINGQNVVQGGTTVQGTHGSLTINPDGSYTYTANGTNTTAVQDVFTYKLTDFDGDSDTATLTIDVGVQDVDDKPELTTSGVTVDETDLNPTDDASNSVTADFGADGPGTYALVGLNGFNGALNNQLTSNGVAVNVVNQGGDLVGLAGTDEVFRLALNEGTGQYTFTLSGTLDHVNPNNPDDTIQLLFDVQAEDSDGDTDSGIITVNVKDDGPEIHKQTSAANESKLDTGPIVINKTLNFDYGEDGAGDIKPTGTVMTLYKVGGQNQTLQSGGQDVVITETADGYVGVAGGDTVFTLVVRNDGSYTYTQNQAIDHPGVGKTGTGDVIWIKFEVEVVDADGDTAKDFIQIDIRDDGPHAVDDTNSAGEGQTVVGNVITNDDVGADIPGSVTMINGQNIGANGLTVQGTYGSLTINQDGSYSYTANSNNPDGVDTFTYKLSDFDGDTDTATLSITVTAEDDVPVVVNAVNSVDETGGFDMVTGNISVNYGGDGPGTTSANGGFSASDATLTSLGKTINVSHSGDTYTGTAGGRTIFTMKINANGTYKFTQLDQIDHPSKSNPDDNVQLRFGVNATDADGDVGTGLVKINVRDDGPNAVNDGRSVNEGGTIQGNVINNDVVGADAPGTITMINGQNIPANGLVVFGQFGTLAIQQNGSYTYVSRQVGSTVTDTFTYKLRDADGDTDTAQLKITVKNIFQPPRGDGDGGGDGGTPLVVDIDRDGIELVSKEDGVLFDMGADGVLDQTGWVAADDGLLALDVNEDGVINDHSELFGTLTTDGFTVLAEHDSNADGVIDAQDEVFDELVVWQDANQNGISESEELLGLSDLEIASISLNAETSSEVIAGNSIILDGSLTYEDGSEGQIVDAVFQFEAADTLYDSNDQEAIFFEAIREESVESEESDGDEGEASGLSGLLNGYDALQDSIDDFVFHTQGDENVNVSVEQAGQIDQEAAMNVLETVTGLSAEDIVKDSGVI